MTLFITYADEDMLRGQGSRSMMAVIFRTAYEMGGTSHNLELRSVWNKIPQL